LTEAIERLTELWAAGVTGGTRDEFIRHCAAEPSCP
jgi:hypothetical protein